jgi:hypothetical protein
VLYPQHICAISPEYLSYILSIIVLYPQHICAISPAYLCYIPSIFVLYPQHICAISPEYLRYIPSIFVLYPQDICAIYPAYLCYIPSIFVLYPQHICAISPAHLSLICSIQDHLVNYTNCDFIFFAFLLLSFLESVYSQHFIVSACVYLPGFDTHTQATGRIIAFSTLVVYFVFF